MTCMVFGGDGDSFAVDWTGFCGYYVITYF